MNRFVVGISPAYAKRLGRLSDIQDACVILIVLFSIAPLAVLYFSGGRPTDMFYNTLTLSPFAVFVFGVIYFGMKNEFDEKLTKIINDISAVVVKFGTKACIFELIGSWWKTVEERIKQVYEGSVPEERVSQFINAWVKVSEEIRQEYLDSPEMMGLQLDLAWKELMKAHKIPLVFYLHKSENVEGGAFFIISFRRPDYSETAFLNAIRQTAKLYGTTEVKGEA